MHARRVINEWTKLDADQNGFVSLSEIESRFQSEGLSQQWIEEVFEMMDSNSDDKISLEEFSKGYAATGTQSTRVHNMFCDAGWHLELP